MTQTEILYEFKQLPIAQQLEMLKAAFEIIEASFIESQKSQHEKLPLATVDKPNDPLLALAGQFSAPVSDASTHHDKYIGEALANDHA